MHLLDILAGINGAVLLLIVLAAALCCLALILGTPRDGDL